MRPSGSDIMAGSYTINLGLKPEPLSNIPTWKWSRTNFDPSPTTQLSPLSFGPFSHLFKAKHHASLPPGACPAEKFCTLYFHLYLSRCYMTRLKLAHLDPPSASWPHSLRNAVSICLSVHREVILYNFMFCTLSVGYFTSVLERAPTVEKTTNVVEKTENDLELLWRKNNNRRKSNVDQH